MSFILKKNSSENLWNIPNALTASRIIGIPCFILSSIYNLPVLGLWIILFALASDLFDGKLARRLGQTTIFGSIFDPVADKMVSLFYLSFFYSIGLLPIWYLILVWIRDLSQLASIPVLLWCLKRPFKVKPKWYGKWGTAIPLFIMVICQLKIIFNESFFWEFGFIRALVFISAAFELIILITYLPRFLEIAKGEHDTFE